MQPARRSRAVSSVSELATGPAHLRHALYSSLPSPAVSESLRAGARRAPAPRRHATPLVSDRLAPLCPRTQPEEWMKNGITEMVRRLNFT